MEAFFPSARPRKLENLAAPVTSTRASEPHACCVSVIRVLRRFPPSARVSSPYSEFLNTRHLVFVNLGRSQLSLV